MLALKLGADSSLLVSPVKVKLGCCRPAVPDVLVLVLLVEVLLPKPELDELLRSIHGTATCLPPAADVEEPIPVVEEVLDEVELVLVPTPLVLPNEPPLNEMTANSRRPELASMMVSLIVPI